MMEPLSIATGCASLLTGVSKLSIQISAFVSSVRDAHKDMDAVSRELTSLSLCLEMLRADSVKTEYPDGFRDNLLTVLKNCDMVTTDMTALLEKLSSATLLQRIQWTAVARDEMNKLRSSLESHKSALDIALDMTSLLLISAVKNDIAEVKADTAQIPSIKQDTSQIKVLVQQIGLLCLQLDEGRANDAEAQHLQRFLAQSTAYAESVMDAMEDEEHRTYPSERSISDSSEESEAPHVARLDVFSDKPEDSPARRIRPPAKREPTDQDANTTKVPKQIAQAKPGYRKRGSARRETSTPSHQRFLLSYRDKEAIQTATVQRNAMNGQDQARLTDALYTAVWGKKSLANRLRSKPSGYGSRVGSFDEIKNLLDGGANPTYHSLEHSYCVIEMKNSGRVEVLELLLMRGTSFDLFQADAWLPRAAAAGNGRLVGAFLDCGASPDSKDDDGYSAISLASTGGHTHIVRLLLDHGAKADDKAVGTAATRGLNEIVEILLDNGASPNATDGTISVLENAVANGHREVVKLLLERGASASSPENNALWTAAGHGRADLVKLLLDNGAPVNCERRNRTILNKAVRENQFNVVKALLESGATIRPLDIATNASANISVPSFPSFDGPACERNIFKINVLLREHHKKQKAERSGQQ